MAQIGYGYGSEFQLLRFLGHHRDRLESIIKETIKKEGNFHWLDFGFNNGSNSISGDDEIKGLNFIEKLYGKECFDKVKGFYNEYKVGSMISSQSWDALFTLEDTLYIVEAKAYPKEMKSNGKRASDDLILKFMSDMLKPICVNAKWVSEYYQLANRLATTALLNRCGIKAKILCLFFVNGYSVKRLEGRKVLIDNERSKNSTITDFEQEIGKEMKELGITYNDVSNYLTPHVFVDANPLIRT